MKPELETLQSLGAPEVSGIDTSLFVRVGRRRWPIWIVACVLVFAALSAEGLFLYPQNYSATVSISMQQPNQSAAALLGLTGSSANKKYTGVIKSRRFAEMVDKRVHFRELMNLSDTRKHQNEAIERVIKDLKVDDNATDGLLYVTVNIAGPARLAPDPGNRDQRRSKAVALAANLYSDALKDYLKNTDTDKDLALRRSADLEVAKAQNAYDRSIAGLADYIRQTRILMVPAGGSGSGGGGASTEAAGGATQVATLYGRRAQLEAMMKSSEAVTADTRRMVAGPSQALTAMPDEDPLLFAARREVNEAANRLHTLQITFGSSMQSVRRAQETLNLAEDRLHTQVQSILKGNTSEHLKQVAMQSEWVTLDRQIRTAEENFQYNRNTTMEIERRRNDVTFKVETLKAFLTKYAELKLQTVPAQNRMAVVDEARPPQSATPGITIILAVSALGGILVVLLWWVIEYLLAARQSDLTPVRVHD